MTNDLGDPPKHLTFSQRHGYEPLPAPMRLDEISDDLRREIWNTIRQLLLGIQESENSDYFNTKEQRFIERVRGGYNKLSENKISTYYRNVFVRFERDCLHIKFNKFLEMLEFLINDQYFSSDYSKILAERIRSLFEKYGAAYWLNTSRRPYWFIPSASKEQGEATWQAVKTVEEGGIAAGATAHLRKAAEHLNAGRYADSISDSIHAVESVARVIDPKANKKLGPALNSLETEGLLNHPALKDAFNKLYAYTSDEQGIRHPLLEKSAAAVGLDEAVFMFGACASFSAYLVNRYQKRT